MKKKVVVLFLALALTFTLFIKLSKTEDKLDVPPGMEVIMIGDVRYIAPKGSKVKKSGDVVIVEGHNEYLARKLSEIEQRLSEIEENIKELQKAQITATDVPAQGVQVAPASGEKEGQQQEEQQE